jgi:Protein O-mannosyl-transferase TMEM260-like
VWNDTLERLEERLFLRRKLFRDRNDVIVFLILHLVIFFVYFLTLLPGNGYSGDTCKFHFVGAILGTSHEPGEPLYVLLTAVFSRLFPFGTIAWRINLLSAITATLAIGALYLTQLRMGISRIVAFSLSLCAGLMYTFWSQAVVAEVYALNAFFVAWVLFLYVSWQKTGDLKYFYLGTYCYALSFGDHLIMITALPALLLFVFLVNRSLFRDVKVILVVVLFIVLGASQYAYVIHRYYSAPPGVYIEMAAGTIKKFIFYVTGGQFQGDIFPISFRSLLIVDGPTIAKYIARDMLFLLPLAFYGFYLLRKNPIGWLLLVVIVGDVMFATGYMISDIFTYLIPTYLAATLLCAVGWDALASKIPSWSRVGITLVFPVIFLFSNFALADQHSSTEMSTTCDEILRVAGHDAVIYCPDYSYAMALWYKYYCGGWQARNVQILFPPAPFSPEKVFSAYLRGEEPLPSGTTRTTIPIGLRLFWFAGYNHQYLRYMAFKEKSFDSTAAEFHDELRDGLIKGFAAYDISAHEVWPYLYELTPTPATLASGRADVSGKVLPVSNGQTFLKGFSQKNSSEYLPGSSRAPHSLSDEKLRH